MKRSLFLTVALVALCSTAMGAPKKAPKKVPFPQTAELGNVMYVGDSITHGVASASYRWPLFKIWVDNGISLTEVGVHANNHSGGVKARTPYGTGTFLNVHSAISSERAYEIAGRINKSGRLENSNMFDWLGLDKSYTGNRRIDPETEMPACFFMMIGTNDTLSDSGNAGIHSCISEKEKDLLGKKGDMDTIIGAMRQGNAKASIAVTTIPTWAPGRSNNAAPEDFAAIEQYNKKLKTWGKSNKVAVVEVNEGMIDLPGVKDIPFVGLPSMFGRDKLHPSPQGDLIIAGNIAQQLGYAGRTAGLTRKEAADFPMQADKLPQAGKKGSLTVAAGETVAYQESGESGQGGTVEIRFGKKGYGNGAKGGWEHEKPMTLTLTTAAATGTLSIGEAYISWEGTTLYAEDMSRAKETIRLAYVTPVPAKGRVGGFYVWLGDKLIGEGLAGSAGGKAGFSLSCGSEPVRLTQLGYDPVSSWAPASKRFSAGNPLIEGSGAESTAVVDDGSVVVRNVQDAERLSAKGGAISAAGATASPRTVVFDGAAVSAKALKLADAEEVHIINGSAVVLENLGGATKLVVDATSRLGLTPGEYEASVLNSGTIIIAPGAALSLRTEGTDENETGTYVVKGALRANNVRMSNTVRVEGGETSGLGKETFRGKLETK